MIGRRIPSILSDADRKKYILHIITDLDADPLREITISSIRIRGEELYGILFKSSVILRHIKRFMELGIIESHSYEINNYLIYKLINKTYIPEHEISELDPESDYNFIDQDIYNEY